MAKFRSKAWCREWGQRAAWTPVQLARMCWGLDPDDGVMPGFTRDPLRTAMASRHDFQQRLLSDEHRRWRTTLEEIMVFVRTRHLALPIIKLRWPAPLGASKENEPLFRPADAYRWAKAHYPKTMVKFAASDFTIAADPTFPPAFSVFVEKLARALGRLRSGDDDAQKKLIGYLVEEQIPRTTAAGIATEIHPKRSRPTQRRQSAKR